MPSSRSTNVRVQTRRVWFRLDGESAYCDGDSDTADRHRCGNDDF